MNVDEIERVFGRGRLRMATGEHVEVYREAVGPGERRRYTKRFLETGDADFREWTAREWRILARLIGHGIRCVPDVVQYDAGAEGGRRQVQTYDAGVTVDQWATLIPVSRNGVARAQLFEDCAHWWALAHHCLAALDEIHALGLVHLDVKADNLCIPYAPTTFDPAVPGARLRPAFDKLALIDFAFSLVSHESLASALPIGWQKDFDYQSPRLLAALDAGRRGDLEPTQELDWRCDLYSLAAMLRRYLPADDWVRAHGEAAGWTTRRYEDARALVFRLRECHDGGLPARRPHRALVDASGELLQSADLARSLAYGWTIGGSDAIGSAGVVPATPMTRIAAAPRTRVVPTVLPRVVVPPAPAVVRRRETIAIAAHAPDARSVRHRARPRVALGATIAAVVAAAVAAPSFVADATLDDAVRMALGRPPVSGAPSAPPAAEAVASERATTEPATPPPVAPAPAATEPAMTAPATAPAAPAPVATAPATTAPATTAATATARDETSADRAGTAPTHAAASAPRVETPSTPRADASVAAGAATVAAAAPARTTTGATHVARSRTAASPPAPRTAVAAARATARKPPAPVVAIAPRSAKVEPTLARAAPRAPTGQGPTAKDLAATAALAAAALAAPATAARDLTPAVREPIASPPAPAGVPADVAPRPAEHRSEPATIVASVPSASPAATPVVPEPYERGLARAEPESRNAPPPSHPSLRSRVRDFFRTLVANAQPPAPVEERIARAPASSPAAPWPQAPAAQPPRERADVPARRAIAVAPAPVRDPVAPVRDGAPDDRRILADAVARIAEQARVDASPVLWIARHADDPVQERAVADAAHRAWPSERAFVPPGTSPARARRLYDDARQSYGGGREATALDLALRAFNANPRDAEIAGFLAFLHLRAQPAQPETARQLALHALAMSGGRRDIRIDDWTTLAIASALTGREADAGGAMLVALALSPEAEPVCRAAQRAYASHGEPVRVLVQAIGERLQASGRIHEAPSCAGGGWRVARRWQ